MTVIRSLHSSSCCTYLVSLPIRSIIVWWNKPLNRSRKSTQNSLHLPLNYQQSRCFLSFCQTIRNSIKKKKKYKENLAWLSSLFAWRENPKDTTAYGRDEGVSDVNRVGTGNEITINHGEEIERELGYIEEKERVKCRLSRNRQWYDTPRLYLYTFETSKTNHAEEKKTLEFIYLRLLVALPMLPQKRSGVHLALKSGRQRLLNGGSHTSR